MKKVDFSKGSVSAAVIKVAMPMMLAEFVNLLYSMVDRIYIGHLPGEGSAALTGLGLCFPVISLVAAFGRLFGYNGGAPLCGMELGKGNREEAAFIMGNSFTLSLITGAVLTALTLIFMRPLLFAFGASDATYPYAREYLLIYSLGTVPMLVTLGMNAFINTQGFSQIGMLTVVIGAVTNILLDPLFIYTFGMGVGGAATATVISQILSMVFVLIFLRGRSADLRLSRKYMKLNSKRCKKIVALGTSGFIMGATNSAVQLVCNRAAFVWGGDLYVGVMTILNSVREVFGTPCTGLGSGSQPVMSFNYGAKNGERVMKASNFTLLSALFINAVVWGAVHLFPGEIAGLFSSDPELVAAAEPALRIYFFGFIFMAFQTAGQQTFVALGKVKSAIFFSLLRKAFIVVPLTIILPYFFGLDGVWLAEPVSNVLGGLAAYITMRLTVFPELRKLDCE